MSFKWIRTLVSHSIRTDFSPMNLRRTLPQSKAISKIMKPARITPTPQQINKLDMLKNTNGLLEQISKEKCSRLISPEKLEHLMKKTLSPSSRVRPSSRCLLRSVQSTPRRYLFNFCQSQNRLRRRKTLMDRFHDICQGHGQNYSLLDNPFLRPPTRRFQIRDYSTEKTFMKASTNNMVPNIVPPGNLELVLNTIKASKALHDLKVRNLSDNKLPAPKLFQGAIRPTQVNPQCKITTVEKPSLKVKIQNQLKPCRSSVENTPNMIFHPNADNPRVAYRPLSGHRSNQKPCQFMSTFSTQPPKPEPKPIFKFGPEDPFVTNTARNVHPESHVPKREVNPFLQKKQNLSTTKIPKQKNANTNTSGNIVPPAKIEPSITYQIIQNARKKYVPPKDMDVHTIVHKSRIVVRQYRTKPTFQTSTDTSLNYDLNSESPKTNMVFPATIPERSDAVRYDDIKTLKGPDSISLFSRSTSNAAANKQNLRPMIRQSRDLSIQKISQKTVNVKSSNKIKMASSSQIPVPSIPQPTISGNPCKFKSYPDSDYKPYYQRFSPKPKKVVKIKYPVHKTPLKLKESNGHVKKSDDLIELEELNSKSFIDGSTQVRTATREKLKTKEFSRLRHPRFLYRTVDKENNLQQKSHEYQQRGTIFVDSNHDLDMNNEIRRVKAHKFQNREGLKLRPCDLCGLYHSLSTRQCPLSDWFKTPATTDIPPQALSYRNRRNYGTHCGNNSNRPSNSTEELLNVCKYCGVVHTNDNEICPMKEALKLFSNEETPTLTKLLMENPTQQSMEDRIMALNNTTTENTKKIGLEKIVFQRPTSTMNEKVMELQACDNTFRRITPNNSAKAAKRNLNQMKAFKSGLFKDKYKNMGFSVPSFNMKRTETNLKTIMKAKKDPHGCLFKSLERCKTLNEQKYTGFVRNLCTLLQDLMQEYSKVLKLSDNAKITGGKLKFLIEDKDPINGETKSWIQNITLEKNHRLGNLSPNKLTNECQEEFLTSKVPKSSDSKFPSRSRNNFEVITGLTPSVDASVTRINSAGSRSFNTCCRSANMKYSPFDDKSPRKVSIEGILSGVQNSQKNSVFPPNSNTKNWRVFQPVPVDLKTPDTKTLLAESRRQGNKKRSKIYDDVLKIEKLQKCIDILKHRVKQKAKPGPKKGLALSETFLRKETKVIKRCLSTHSHINRKRSKFLIRDKKKKKMKFSSKPNSWNKQATSPNNKRPVTKKNQSETKMIPRSAKLHYQHFIRKSKSLEVLKRKPAVAKAPTRKSLNDPLGQTRVYTPKDMCKRGIQIGRPLKQPSSSQNTPKDMKACGPNEVPQFKMIKKRPACYTGSPRKICDENNLREFFLEVFKVPECEMNMIQARLRKENERKEMEAKKCSGEEFYKYYKANAHKTTLNKPVCIEVKKTPPPMPPYCPQPIPFCGEQIKLPAFETKKKKKKRKIYKVIMKPGWKYPEKPAKPPAPLKLAVCIENKPTGKDVEVFLPNWDEVKKPRIKTPSGSYTNKKCDSKKKDPDEESTDETMEKFFEFDHLKKEKCVMPEPVSKGSMSKLTMMLPNPQDVKAKLQVYAQECKLRLRKLSPFRDAADAEKNKQKVEVVQKKADEMNYAYKKVPRNKQFDGFLSAEVQEVKCDDDKKDSRYLDGDHLEKIAVVVDRHEKAEEKKRKRKRKEKARKEDEEDLFQASKEHFIDCEKAPEEHKTLTLKACPPALYLPKKEEPDICKPKVNDVFCFEEKQEEKPKEVCKEPEKPRVVCREPEKPKVVCREPEKPRVVCREPEKPRVVCREPEKPKVVCREPEKPRVVCREPEKLKVVCRDHEKPKVVYREPEKPKVICREPAKIKVVYREEKPKFVSKVEKPKLVCKEEKEKEKEKCKAIMKSCEAIAAKSSEVCEATEKGKANWVNFITDAVKGSKKIQYAKVSKAEMDALYKTVLKEIKSRKAENLKDADSTRCLLVEEDLKKCEPKESKTWKYLEPAEDEACEKKESEKECDKTGLQLQKCLNDVRKCLDEYKQCLKEFEILPKMAPEFEFNMEEAQKPCLIKEQKPPTCDKSFKYREPYCHKFKLKECNRDEPTAKFCYADSTCPKQESKVENVCEDTVGEPKCQLAIAAIDPLKASALEAQQLGNIIEDSRLLVSPAAPSRAFSRCVQRESKTRGLHLTSSIPKANNTLSDTSVNLKKVSVVKEVEGNVDKCEDLQNVKQVTLYCPYQTKFRVELILPDGKKPSDLIIMKELGSNLQLSTKIDDFDEQSKDSEPIVVNQVLEKTQIPSNDPQLDLRIDDSDHPDGRKSKIDEMRSSITDDKEKPKSATSTTRYSYTTMNSTRRSSTLSSRIRESNDFETIVANQVLENQFPFGLNNPAPHMDLEISQSNEDIKPKKTIEKKSDSITRYNYTNLDCTKKSSLTVTPLTLLFDEFERDLILDPKNSKDFNTEVEAVYPPEEFWPRSYYPNAHPPFVNRKFIRPDLSPRSIRRLQTEALNQPIEENLKDKDVSCLKEYLLQKKLPRVIEGQNEYCVKPAKEFNTEKCKASLTNILHKAGNQLRTSAQDCCKDLLRSLKEK